MIAVDTNVLVRLLVADEPAQHSRAVALFDDHAAADASIWVSDTVLVELVWTLARTYSRARPDLAEAVRTLSQHATVRLESGPVVREALALFEGQSCDFADCLLAAKAARAGCDEVVTFDKGMKKLPQVRLL